MIQLPRPHKAEPVFIPIYHRYQCAACHSWIYYEEFEGWWHITERNAPKKWDGRRWVIADFDQWQTSNTRATERG